jgi:hypothetical protein
MIFVANDIFSQKLPANYPKGFPSKPSIIDSSLLSFRLQPITTLNKKNALIPPDFYVRQLGFFCKQEIRFEKITRLPLRFRLGSVEDCDRMEGKRKKN